jgi:antitoxin component YwqK of YwqJK toxin-antitoxin module
MSQTISEITTGLIRTFHDEEKTKLKEEYFIHINKKEGIHKEYYVDGQLFEEVNYINDKKEGIKKTYRENGQIEEEVNYINNKKEEINKILVKWRIRGIILIIRKKGYKKNINILGNY